MFTSSRLTLAAALLFTTFGAVAVQAEQQQLSSHARTSCSVRAVDEYYCPVTGSGWQGPYFDNGCSVQCADGQEAVCTEASCASDQSGNPVSSSCTCQ